MDKTTYIHERTQIIPIKKTYTTTKQQEYIYEHNMYSLNNNLIDPSKSSPPNNFIKNLHTRMNFYNNSLGIKLDN